MPDYTLLRLYLPEPYILENFHMQFINEGMLMGHRHGKIG